MAQCSDDVGVVVVVVVVAIGWGCWVLLEMHLESLELKDWGGPECWAAESYLEAVADSTLFVVR